MQLMKSAYVRTGAALGSVLLFKVSSAFAANDNAFNQNDSTLQIQGGTNLNESTDGQATLVNFANKALNIILLIVGILAVFYLIYSGFLYITSAGSPDKVKLARQGIINAIIGIVIVLAAFFIVKFAVGVGTTVSQTPTS